MKSISQPTILQKIENLKTTIFRFCEVDWGVGKAYKFVSPYFI